MQLYGNFNKQEKNRKNISGFGPGCFFYPNASTYFTNPGYRNTYVYYYLINLKPAIKSGAKLLPECPGPI